MISLSNILREIVKKKCQLKNLLVKKRDFSLTINYMDPNNNVGEQ